jgi:toxin ParE1/3/4
VRIIWSPLARKRLGDIGEFVAQNRPKAAEDLIRAILASVRRLELYPLSGRRVLESPRTDLREVICGNYRIIYRVEADQVTVLTVRHARQDLKSSDPDLQ